MRSTAKWKSWPAEARRELLRRLRATVTLRDLRLDPTLALRLAGLSPDPWQAELLRSTAPRELLLCTRSAGKSTAAAALALNEALLRSASLVLLFSPTERQSGELAQKVWGLYEALACPIPATKRTELQLHLANGSRVIALPGNERTVRGYNGVRLAVVDEAARVPDELYLACRPMLSVSRGRLLCLSTPFGQRGWFYEAWEGRDGVPWRRTPVPATACPRIDPAFLAEERAAMGPRWYAQEYLLSFEAAVDAAFDPEAIRDAFSDHSVRPLWE